VLQPVIDKVPQGTHPEHKIEVTILGVPMLGYLDDFTMENKAIEEYKTGIRDKKGKAPWDRVKVRKHKQLPLYTLMVKEKYGSWNPEINLTWMETVWGNTSEEIHFGGNILRDNTIGLKLTGHVEVFPRTIKEWELDRMAEIIRKVAEEISIDYQLWKNKNSTSLS